tara:strand:+ start:147 stop:263 length:117 start_codon:yes stop_codon:yes gene_type:complete
MIFSKSLKGLYKIAKGKALEKENNFSSKPEGLTAYSRG